MSSIYIENSLVLFNNLYQDRDRFVDKYHANVSYYYLSSMISNSCYKEAMEIYRQCFKKYINYGIYIEALRMEGYKFSPNMKDEIEYLVTEILKDIDKVNDLTNLYDIYTLIEIIILLEGDALNISKETYQKIFDVVHITLNRHDKESNMYYQIMYMLKYMQVLFQGNIEYPYDDIDEFLKLDITHISTYSLIIEPNTKLYINNVKNIDDNLDYEMYKLICNKLKDNGYNHYEISNFSKVGYESKHNLTYWNNDNYYGFGMGASGYIDNVRYDNTRNINKYLNGEYVKESHTLDLNETIENEFILGLRKIKGINKETFKNKYNKDIKEIEIVNKLIKENKLLEDEKNIYINKDYIYVSNDILVEFID